MTLSAKWSLNDFTQRKLKTLLEFLYYGSILNIFFLFCFSISLLWCRFCVFLRHFKELPLLRHISQTFQVISFSFLHLFTLSKNVSLNLTSYSVWFSCYEAFLLLDKVAKVFSYCLLNMQVRKQRQKKTFFSCDTVKKKKTEITFIIV